MYLRIFESNDLEKVKVEVMHITSFAVMTFRSYFTAPSGSNEMGQGKRALGFTSLQRFFFPKGFSSLETPTVVPRGGIMWDASATLFCFMNCIPFFCLLLQRINFTNPLAQSTNVLKHIVWRNQFHQQNFAKLYQSTHKSLLHPTFTLHALHCTQVS